MGKKKKQEAITLRPGSILDLGKKKKARIAEHKKIYTNENGVELEIKMKAECSTDGEMREALSFMAQSSHNFYLEMAKEISNGLVCEKKAK